MTTQEDQQGASGGGSRGVQLAGRRWQQGLGPMLNPGSRVWGGFSDVAMRRQPCTWARLTSAFLTVFFVAATAAGDQQAQDREA